MRKTALLVGLAVVMGLAGLTSASPSVAEPERWIVGFYGYPDYQPGDHYGPDPVLKVNNPLKFIVVETVNPVLLQARVTLDDAVRYVEPDSTDWELTLTPNDPFYSHAAHWGTKRIGAATAWDTTTGSSAVKVAHVDSGLNKGHEDIQRYLQGIDTLNGDNDPDDSNGCNWHGTHTTGTAGSPINNGLGFAGVSGQHTILPVKIFGPGFFGCGTTTTAIVDALQYTGDQGAHLSSNSWGGGSFSTAIDDAITYAHNRGVIHVAAAGNSGPCSNCVGEPWRSAPDRSIVVTSLTDGDTFSSFSSQGSQVDVIAPGDFIGAACSGTADYCGMSGTSMATPHVTGALALHLAVNPGASFSQVMSALGSTSEDLGFTSDRQGLGLVRADNLVSGGSPPPATACSDGVDNDGDGLVDLADPGCTDASDDDETDPTPPPGGFTLEVNGYKVKGTKHGDLTWSGATSTNVDVYRDGSVVATTANDGFYTDNTGQKGGGSTSWTVCEAGTSTCSNTATWNW